MAIQGFEGYARPASELGLTPGDKRRLIDDVTEHLGIGGWTSSGRWDVSDEDVEEEWSVLSDSFVDDQGEEPDAFRVALLVAVRFERQCWGVR